MKSSGKRVFSKKSGLVLEPELTSLMRLVENKQVVEAEAAARRILGRRPGNHLAMKALSFALIHQARYEEALPLLQHAVKAFPQDPELHNNFGIVLSALMYWEDSLVEFEQARAMQADDAEILRNMGIALSRMRRWGDAVPVLLQAIEKYDGDYVDAIYQLAACLQNSGRIEEAWTCYRELHQADEDNPGALFEMLYTGLRCGRWEELDKKIQTFRQLTRQFENGTSNPFSALAVPGISSAEHMSITRQHVRLDIPPSVLNHSPRLPVVPLSERRLRVGYISGDLCRHPVGFVLPEVIEHHDRSRVETFAYSTMTPEPDDPFRPRFVNAFEHLTEVGELPMRQLAEKIRSDGVDILVDLSGWTAHGRPEAMALRCAPVQVNWLGYAGTMGHEALADYILGDPVVTPLEHAEVYTEAIAQMPGCYLPADTRRPVPSPTPRSEFGIPEDAFVFCSFNNTYKYNPKVFDVWSDILKEIPNSLLWISYGGEAFCERLRHEIATRGVAAERLMFARRLEANDAYLARIAIADLALDTFPYNSHSTGIDTLWAGVPMISLLGTTFAGRVGASLVKAAGLGDLAVETIDEYRNLAITLAKDRERLDGIREKLGQSRATSTLFDMRRFCRELENIFFRMQADAEQGVRRHLLAPQVL